MEVTHLAFGSASHPLDPSAASAPSERGLMRRLDSWVDKRLALGSEGSRRKLRYEWPNPPDGSLRRDASNVARVRLSAP